MTEKECDEYCAKVHKQIKDAGIPDDVFDQAFYDCVPGFVGAILAKLGLKQPDENKTQ